MSGRALLQWRLVTFVCLFAPPVIAPLEYAKEVSKRIAIRESILKIGGFDLFSKKKNVLSQSHLFDATEHVSAGTALIGGHKQKKPSDNSLSLGAIEHSINSQLNQKDE